MTITECGPEQVSIDDEIEAGYRLGMARDELGNHLSDQLLSVTAYETLVRDYLNALTDFHFGPNSKPHFTTTDEVVSMVRNEISLIARASTIDDVDVGEKLTGYCHDERARWLIVNDLPVIPRAVILTMIDLIDDNRPFPL